MMMMIMMLYKNVVYQDQHYRTEFRSGKIIL